MLRSITEETAESLPDLPAEGPVAIPGVTAGVPEEPHGSRHTSSNLSEDELPVNTQPTPGISSSAMASVLQSYFAQFFASVVTNLLALFLAIGLAYPFSNYVSNGNGVPVHFAEHDKLMLILNVYVLQIIGCAIAGISLEMLRRKLLLNFVCLPIAISWLIISRATCLAEFYGATLVMALCRGFVQVTIAVYQTEIASPNWRRGLVSFSAGFNALGMCLMTVIEMTRWKHFTIVPLGIMLIALVGIYNIPESPVWLMLQGKEKEAKAALCWLRGWVGPESIEQEFQSLARLIKGNRLLETVTAPMKKSLRVQKYRENVDVERGVENTTAEQEQMTGRGNDVGIERALQVANELSARRKLKPFMKVFCSKSLKSSGMFIFLFFSANFTGATLSSPYTYEVIKQADIFVGETLILNFICFLAIVLRTFTINRWVMRHVALTCQVLAIACTFSLFLNNPWVIGVAHIFLKFLTGFGLHLSAWAMLCETSPTRNRGIVIGIGGALNTFCSLAATTWFHELQQIVGMHYFIGINGTINVLNFFLIYFLLPRTNNFKTLEDMAKEG